MGSCNTGRWDSGTLNIGNSPGGAVVRQRRCQIGEYCMLFLQRWKQLLNQKAVQNWYDYQYTAYTTWEVSPQIIEETSNEAGQDALELLQVFSFLHHEGTLKEIFQRACHTAE